MYCPNCRFDPPRRFQKRGAPRRAALFSFRAGRSRDRLLLNLPELLQVGLDLVFRPRARIRSKKKTRRKSLVPDPSRQRNAIADDAALFQIFESEEFLHSLLHRLRAVSRILARVNVMERLVTACCGFLLGGDSLSFSPVLFQCPPHGAIIDAEVIGNAFGTLGVGPLARIFLFESVP